MVLTAFEPRRIRAGYVAQHCGIALLFLGFGPCQRGASTLSVFVRTIVRDY